MTVDKTLPHCWKHYFVSGPSAVCSNRRIYALEQVEYHTEQAANDAKDWLCEKLDVYVSVYCVQKEYDNDDEV